MGCKTCKQKKQKEEYSQNNDDTINLIPQEIIDGNYNGNFFFKLIAFFTIIIAIPFILLVLLCQLFISFFLPKSLPKVSKKFKAFLMSGLGGKYAPLTFDSWYNTLIQKEAKDNDAKKDS